MINVWHKERSELNGPTLSSLLGIVISKGFPSVDKIVKEITTGRDEIFEHGIPYAPGLDGLGLISGEIITYIAF